MKALVTQSNYIPWKGYFDAIASVDVMVLYDDMQYTRRDWRNRNMIKTQQGLQWLTIPVKVKGKYHQCINETRVSDLSWAVKHWETLRHSYGRAPFFAELKPIIEPLYINCKEELLSRINYMFISTLCNFLGINTVIKWSSEFVLDPDRSQRLINICKDLGADEYMSGPLAKAYMDVPLFEKHGIKVHFFDYSNYPEYPQLYPPFEHKVSILDLLFNTGVHAMKYFKFS